MLGNKKLPAADYRVRLGHWLPQVDVLLALPGCPDGFDEAHWLPIGLREGVRPKDLLHWLRLIAQLRAQRNDVDVAHFFSTQLVLLGPLVARAVGIRPWVTVTGFGRIFADDHAGARLLRPMYRAMLGCAVAASERTFFQNHGDLETARGWLPWLASRLEWIGSAMDLPVAEVRPPGPGPLRVLLVSRVMPSKGVDVFVEVARTVTQQWADAPLTFTLVGPPGDGAGELVEEVERAHCDGCLVWMRERTGEELEEIYRQHDVLFFPSRGEGMSRVMLEAAFHGLCPVASRIPANEDLVGSDRGVLVDVGSIERAAGALQDLQAKPQHRYELARAYQQFVTREYGMEAFAARVACALERPTKKR